MGEGVSATSLFLQRSLFVFSRGGVRLAVEAGGDERGSWFSFGVIELRPSSFVQYFGILE